MVAPYTGLDLAPPPGASLARRPRQLGAADVLSMLEQREAANIRRSRWLMLLGLVQPWQYEFGHFGRGLHRALGAMRHGASGVVRARVPLAPVRAAQV